MTEQFSSFNSNELSPEDLEVVRAFLAADDFETLPPDGSEPPSLQESGALGDANTDDVAIDDEMLAVFTNEVREDIATLRRALEHVEQDERLDSPGLLALRRAAHKIRGTSSAIGCEIMSTIAHSIELLIDMAHSEQVELFTTVIALSHAIGALQMTLESVETEKQEHMLPLLSLEQDLAALQIHVQLRETPDAYQHHTRYEPDDGKTMRVDRHHLNLLLQQVEVMAGQQGALDEARRAVERALEEVQATQSRLKRVETYVATLRTTLVGNQHSDPGFEMATSSSLVARILREASQRTGHTHLMKARNLSLPAVMIETASWDELELDNYTETPILVYALNEAVADVATASTQLQAALTRLDALVKQQATRIDIMRDHARELPVPYSTDHTNAPAAPGQHTLQRAALGLLLRVGEQQVIVPFTQVQRIDNRIQEASDVLFTLDSLLDFPTAAARPQPSTGERPIIILRDEPSSDIPRARWVVQVDEVLGQVELLAQSAPPPLRRRGISGLAINSAGAVLLVLDLPELIRRQLDQLGEDKPGEASRPARRVERAPRILIVDDSLYIRRSLQQTLGQQGYVLFEASDGVEALERMIEDTPDVLLLDLEMPNLNGYDLLAIRHNRKLLPDLKVILLTSRSSEKHRQHAGELGIHAYLTKPCPEHTLRKTVADLLRR